MTKLDSVKGTLELKAYNNTCIKLPELSPFTVVTDGNGKEIVVRKSSICWLLRKTNGKLSSDRIQRVRQETLSLSKNTNSGQKSKKKSKNLQAKQNIEPTSKYKPVSLPRRYFIKAIFFSGSADDPNKVQVGNYVVAEFLTKKSTKHFVGLITDKQDSEYEIKFLKHIGNSMFSYPQIDDVCFIEQDQIKSILSQPAIDNRMRYCFTEKLSAFNI